MMAIDNSKVGKKSKHEFYEKFNKGKLDMEHLGLTR